MSLNKSKKTVVHNAWRAYGWVSLESTIEEVIDMIVSFLWRDTYNGNINDPNIRAFIESLHPVHKVLMLKKLHDLNWSFTGNLNQCINAMSVYDFIFRSLNNDVVLAKDGDFQSWDFLGRTVLERHVLRPIS